PDLREKGMKPLPADALIVIPMRNTVLFPGVISPITVGRPGSVAAAQEAARTNKPIGFLLQRDAEKSDVKPGDLFWVGASGNVVRYITGNEGAHHLVVQGEARFLQLTQQASEAIELLPNAPGELSLVVQGMTSAGLLADMVANLLDVKS